MVSFPFSALLPTPLERELFPGTTEAVSSAVFSAATGAYEVQVATDEGNAGEEPPTAFMSKEGADLVELGT